MKASHVIALLAVVAPFVIQWAMGDPTYFRAAGLSHKVFFVHYEFVKLLPLAGTVMGLLASSRRGLRSWREREGIKGRATK